MGEEHREYDGDDGYAVLALVLGRPDGRHRVGRIDWCALMTCNARKQAEDGPQDRGFATPACKHQNCDYSNVFPGDGTEHVAKTCDDCAHVWTWTN